ncbi:MAG: Ribbon-Helix-Helix transcriptional regulator family [Candidatus Woesearchaeota archaeon]|nr:Ribbon-Helix-Helix transcriptional regulator family [Candidatus Woesearchaeota archaeon]MDK2907970.1 Ribbon-Helix-Helix transcriptional regulator family [Candidatus Woesearchaeota archaeon]
MVMETIQIRLNQGLLRLIDSLVDKGIYSNRSEVIRDAVRRFVWEKEVGTVPNNGDSVEQIREIRKILSSQPIDLDEINSL